MQEHKRERASVESRLNSVEKRAQYHDEHIVIIDAWFSEVCLVALGLLRFTGLRMC